MKTFLFAMTNIVVSLFLISTAHSVQIETGTYPVDFTVEGVVNLTDFDGKNSQLNPCPMSVKLERAFNLSLGLHKALIFVGPEFEARYDLPNSVIQPEGNIAVPPAVTMDSNSFRLELEKKVVSTAIESGATPCVYAGFCNTCLSNSPLSNFGDSHCGYKFSISCVGSKSVEYKVRNIESFINVYVMSPTGNASGRSQSQFSIEKKALKVISTCQ